MTTTVTLTSLPPLPFDLVPEILCRLPVKLLLQFRCVCKSWKSLISDPKFAKKHLHMSKASMDRHHIILYTNLTYNSPNLFPWTFQISSLFRAALSTSSDGVTQTQLSFPDNILYPILRVCSCDGVICFTVNNRLLLWNPSIRKFNMFPPLEHSVRGRRNARSLSSSYSIGYDHFTHTYKIVVVFFFKDDTNQVHVYTLGTDSWKRIGDLPYSCCISKPGVFASGTINWLARDDARSSIVVSLHFEKESYQKILHPNVETNLWTLGVLKECLCIFAYTDMFVDVWIMNECGNNQPWTKLYRVPHTVDRGHHPYCTPLYITEDDQVLMYFHDRSMHTNLVVYDSKSGTYNIPEHQNIDCLMYSEVYVESLISPCS